MQSEQKVCEQLVIIGFSRNSLQTWHRNAESTAASDATGVPIQSELSWTSDAI